LNFQRNIVLNVDKWAMVFDFERDKRNWIGHAGFKTMYLLNNCVQCLLCILNISFIPVHKIDEILLLLEAVNKFPNSVVDV